MKRPEVTYAPRKATNYIVVHCAQTTAQHDCDITEVRDWHALPKPKGNGWMDVGYHFFIKRDGTVQIGRPHWALGAHVKDHNWEAIGVCLAGGSDADGKEEKNFNEAQWTALAALVQGLRVAYPKAVVQGHRDFPGVDKYCPSFNAKPWWDLISKESLK